MSKKMRINGNKETRVGRKVFLCNDCTNDWQSCSVQMGKTQLTEIARSNTACFLQSRTKAVVMVLPVSWHISWRMVLCTPFMLNFPNYEHRHKCAPHSDMVTQAARGANQCCIFSRLAQKQTIAAFERQAKKKYKAPKPDLPLPLLIRQRHAGGPGRLPNPSFPLKTPCGHGRLRVC
jgi:hypothetical protein